MQTVKADLPQDLCARERAENDQSKNHMFISSKKLSSKPVPVAHPQNIIDQVGVANVSRGK